MPLRWRNKPRPDGAAAGERSRAGQEAMFGYKAGRPL